MRYLTKDWFMSTQTYPMPDELKKRSDEIMASYREAQDKELLPDTLRREFMFHDGEVLAIAAGADFVVQIKSPFSDHHKITFREASVKQEIPPVGAMWLYQELYRHKSGDGYEAHILFYKHSKPEHKKVLTSDLFDTKIICKDILLE